MKSNLTNSQPENTPDTSSFEAPRMQSSKRISRRKIAIAALAAGLLASGVGAHELKQPIQAETENSSEAAEGLRDPKTLLRAEQIISTFENSTTEIQYDYVENLGDGRGITAGRSGFTSGTGDLLQVVETYVHLNSVSTPLASYLPALKAINGTEKVTGLNGFTDAWETAMQKDDTLKQAQDIVYKKLYLDPALKRADQSHIKTALGQTIILDTIIQHGEGMDADGLPHIISEVTNTEGSAEGQEEKWLKTFLDIRKHHLENAADPATRKGWQESVERVETLRSILESGNMSLTPPIKWEVYGDSFSIRK